MAYPKTTRVQRILITLQDCYPEGLTSIQIAVRIGYVGCFGAEKTKHRQALGSTLRSLQGNSRRRRIGYSHHLYYALSPAE